MKQLLLVALLAALAASASTAAVMTALRPAAPPAAQGVTAAELRAALVDVAREMAAARAAPPGRAASRSAEDAPPPAATAATSESPSPAAAVQATAPRGDSFDAAPAAPVVRPGRPSALPPSATILEKFQESAPRDESGERDHRGRAEQLARWMLRGERDVFEWFGQPTRIDAGGSSEMWFYEVATGELGDDGRSKVRQYWIRLNRGRVTDMGD